MPAPIAVPEGALSVTHLDGRVWVFDYPRLDDEAYDDLEEAIDLWRVGDLAFAESKYRRLIRRFPEFIDAYHHLALVLDETGRSEEAFGLWQELFMLGWSRFPFELRLGQGLLPWAHLENRPFLRAYHSLGLGYLGRSDPTQALAVFEDILALNPDDNQGVRALAIHCYFRLKRPHDVLAICDRYPDDGLEQVVYGRALALYQLGRKARAGKALREAMEYLPLIAEELAKRRHRRPKNLRWDRVTVGGADQAYLYWHDEGQLWRKTPGAIEWVRSFLPGGAGD